MHMREATFDLEAHQSGAVLHLRGPLSLEQAARAIDAAEALPGRVRHLFVDLREIDQLDSVALEAIAMMLGRWRAVREGGTRVELPRPTAKERAD